MIAVAYLMLKASGGDGGILAFGLAGTSLFLIHFLIKPITTTKAVMQWPFIWRGFILGISQILICEALSVGFTSTALIAGTIGSLVGVILGFVILKERLKGIQFIALIISLSGMLFNPTLLSLSFWAMVAGILQGINATLTRGLIRTDMKKTAKKGVESADIFS